MTKDWTKTTTGELVKAAVSVPGTRAALRRCLKLDPADPRCARGWGHVSQYLPDTAPPAEERAFLAVAAMICAQPPTARTATDTDDTPGTGGSLGWSLAYGVTERRIYNADTALHKLILFSRQNLDGVHRLLPGTVNHLRGALVPIDWARLIQDFAQWPTSRRDTGFQWIKDYHRTRNRIQAKQEREKRNKEGELT